MSRTSRSALVASVSAAVALIPAVPAFAAAEKLDDARGDTYKYTFDDSSGEPVFTPSRKKTNLDVDRSVVTHGNRRVQLAVRYVDMAKDGLWMQPALRVRTSDEREFQLYGVVSKSDGEGWQTSADVYEITAPPAASRPVGPRGEVVAECDETKLDVVVDWKADTVTVSAPRACFGSPTWIKGHVDVLASAGHSGSGFYDHGHNKSSNYEKGWTGQLEKG